MLIALCRTTHTNARTNGYDLLTRSVTGYFQCEMDVGMLIGSLIDNERGRERERERGTEREREGEEGKGITKTFQSAAFVPRNLKLNRLKLGTIYLSFVI